MSTDADVVVVGGGLAGAAAAITLARGGRDVTLLERERTASAKVCGEFLSVSALQSLQRLGFSPLADGAVALSRLRVSARRGEAEMPLGIEAASLTRERLDARMLELAAAFGVDVRRGETVRGVERVAGGWEVAASGGLSARHVVIATGKHELKGRRRARGIHDGMVGLKRFVRPAKAWSGPGTIDLILFPGGYCGIQPVEGGRLNVCLAISQRALRSAGGPEEVFAQLAAVPRGAALLGDAVPDGPIRAVGRVPYGFMRRTSDGAYFVGDQAAVIPSFCGEGMGIALRSGMMAGEALLAGRAAHLFQADLSRLVGRRVRTLGAFSRVVSAGPAQGVAVRLAAIAPGLVQRLSAEVRTPLAPV